MLLEQLYYIANVIYPNTRIVDTTVYEILLLSFSKQGVGICLVEESTIVIGDVGVDQRLKSVASCNISKLVVT